MTYKLEEILEKGNYDDFYFSQLQALAAITTLIEEKVREADRLARIDELNRPINLPLLDELDQSFKDGFLNAVEMLEEVKARRIKALSPTKDSKETL